MKNPLKILCAPIFGVVIAACTVQGEHLSDQELTRFILEKENAAFARYRDGERSNRNPLSIKFEALNRKDGLNKALYPQGTSSYWIIRNGQLCFASTSRTPLNFVCRRVSKHGNTLLWSPVGEKKNQSEVKRYAKFVFPE